MFYRALMYAALESLFAELLKKYFFGGPAKKYLSKAYNYRRSLKWRIMHRPLMTKGG
jgi:hypothetical protein